MSKEYNADFIAGYGHGILQQREQMETPEYIAGYEMGKRFRNRKQHTPQQSTRLPQPPPPPPPPDILPQQSTILPQPPPPPLYTLPGTDPKFITGFSIGKYNALNGINEPPTGYPHYDSGYEMGFVSVPQTSLDEHMAHASNDFARDVYSSFKNLGKSKRTKRDGGKSKRREGKSKRRGGKTKKRNQKK
jgi:hypothetical protein